MSKVKRRIGNFGNLKAFSGMDMRVCFALTTFSTLYMILKKSKQIFFKRG
jgi:hypothetical protein